MRIVTSSHDLTLACESLSASDFVAADTEFMREQTFWPQLCLVQLATHEEAVRNYVIVLKTIGQGHQKLYETRTQLSKAEVEADIQRYANRLKEAFNAVKGL